ncbi:MAG: MraY family glycosyltransferase [Rikenellaceae bacterium]
MAISLLSFAISSIMVAFMLPRILILSLRKKLIDPIDPRKVHSVPASRLGGVTFLPAILFSVWLTIALSNILTPFIGPTINISIKLILESLAILALSLIGIYDDIIGVAYRPKFFVQIFAALLVVTSGVYFKTLHGFCGIDEIPYYIGIPITIFFYVFVTNAINLIDGIDGLASMLSIMALAVYSVLLYIIGYKADSLIAVATLGALIPFWYSNVFGIRKGVGSKIFMGDTGALVIGAILGFLAVTVWNITYNTASKEPIDQVYYILAFTMLLVPCFDVMRIIVHRFLDHKPLFLPDKNHIHHKFMALGYSPRKALLCIIVINIMFMATNILLSYVLNLTFIFILDIIIWTGMHIYISKKIKTN